MYVLNYMYTEYMCVGSSIHTNSCFAACSCFFFCLSFHLLAVLTGTGPTFCAQKWPSK